MKRLLIIFCFFSIVFSQIKTNKINSIKELRTIVENASRANQRVWLEDFTGLE